MRSQALNVVCNAKLNLHLRVLGERPDGYHDIETIYHSIELHDILTIRPAPTMAVTSDSPDVPTDDTNLALRAAVELLRGSGRAVAIHIDKRIPVAAGLGGGSADAAGSLVGVNRLFGLNHTEEHLEAVAAGLGADVKFMLRGGCALGSGRGDRLTDLPSMPRMPVVLVVPPISVSTAWAYRSLKMGLTSGGLDLTMITSALERGEATHLSDFQKNDFEALVLEKYGLLKEIKADLVRAGGTGVLMSGSGPVIYGLFEQAGDAKTCAGLFEGKGLVAIVTHLAGWGVMIPA